MARIAHISDLHFLGVERGAVDALVEVLLGLEPDLIAVSGDLTLSGRVRGFQAARAVLDRLGGRVLGVRAQLVDSGG